MSGYLLRNRMRFQDSPDLDTKRTPGIYAISEPLNGPPDGDLFILHVSVGKGDDARYVFQTLHSLEGHGDMIRFYDGSVWSEWDDSSEGGGGGGGDTDLSTTTDSDSVTIHSSSGDDAEIPSATATDAGVMSAADKELIDNLQSMAFEAAEDFIRAVDIGVLVQAWDADLDAIAALTTTAAGLSVLTVADPGADRILAWDDSAGTLVPIALADITSEAAPDAGDYLLAYTAEGALVKIDWADLPAGGGGISEVVEDTSPHLGGDLDLNGFVITGLEIGTDIQAWDAQLDSLSAASANGVSLVTAADYAAMRALLDLEAGTDFLSPSAIAAAYQPLDSDLTSIAGLSTTAGGRSVLTLADPNADRVLAWDDSAGAIVPIALADITAEGSPAAGDFLLAYTAEGALVKVDWDDLPTGSGISELVEDTTPQLGGDLDLNSNDINGTGNIEITGNIEVTGFFSLATGDMTVTTVHANIVNVSDEAYDQSGWNADLSVPTKNAVRDVLETSFVPVTGSRTLDDDLGLTATSKDDGTKSSGTFTLDFSANFRHCANNGAFTLAPPASGEGMIFLKITNSSSAGAITTSGFTKKVGDDFTTTNGHVFFCTVARSGSVTMLSVTAMQ